MTNDRSPTADRHDSRPPPTDHEPLMHIIVNGTMRATTEGSHVGHLLAELGLDPATVVVEVNRRILERGTYDQAVLGDDDRIEIVRFVGGG